jgi:ABC-type cobalamin/Fe3+-siderophores transport system ATPase subunit
MKKNADNVDALFLYLKDIDALRDVGENLEAKDFFKLLESIHFSNLIHEVRIRVKVEKSDGSLTFRELSEGEQQLLMVLGLLRFTREEESLFLLDEPDTHLNPAWSMEYLHYLQDVAGLDSFVNQKENSHIVIATHDPIVISTLKQQQIQIMKRREGSLEVDAVTPNQDPKGLGYTGILMSDMFGLRSDLDAATLELLDRKAKLAAKDEEELTEQDIKDLEEVNEKLEPTGFLESYSDPYFAQFLKAFANEIDMERFKKPFLSDYERGLAEGVSARIAKRMEGDD